MSGPSLCTVTTAPTLCPAAAGLAGERPGQDGGGQRAEQPEPAVQQRLARPAGQRRAQHVGREACFTASAPCTSRSTRSASK
jgi:hypothetical protein